MSLERRILLNSDAAIRVTQRGGKRRISGYSAVFYQEGDAGTEYKLWDDYVERIRPGAFDRAVKEQHDVKALFNHDPNQLLGRSTSGTCRYSVDSKGLKYEIDVDDNDPDHARVTAKINRGDLTGSSFAFRATRISWEEVEDGPTVRWIDDLQLYDVGPVTYPAYESTSTGLRSENEIVELKRERDLWLKADHEWRERWLRLQRIKSDHDQHKLRADWLAAQRKLTF